MSAPNEDLDYWNHVYEDSQKSARFGRIMTAGCVTFAAVGLVELLDSADQETQTSGIVALLAGGVLAAASSGIKRVNERRGDMALKNIVHIFFNES